MQGGQRENKFVPGWGSPMDKTQENEAVMMMRATLISFKVL